MRNDIFENNTQFRMAQCLVWAVQDVLNFYGLRIEDYAGGQCIFYEYPGQKETKFSRRTKPILEDLREHQLEANENYYQNPEEMWRYVKDLCKAKTPVLVLMDPFYVSHCPDFNETHDYHYMCITEYNPAEGFFMVNDSAYNFLHEKIAESTLREWNSGQPNYLNTIEISTPNRNRGDDWEYFKKMIEFNLRNMLTPDLGEIYEKNTLKTASKPFEQYKVGLKGIYEFSTECELFLSKKPTSESFYAMWATVADLAEQSELHAMYLRRFAKKHQQDKLMELANDFDYIAQNWSLVKNMFFKASFKNTEEMLNRTYDKIHSIAELEEKYLEQIAQFSKLNL